MDATELDRRLAAAFDAPPGACRVVARAMGDFLDSGAYREDAGSDPTPESVVSHLRDAPDGLSLPERWNWWMGALELAYGGYAEFQVHRWREDGDAAEHEGDGE
jgi:hypothetical protein